MGKTQSNNKPLNPCQYIQQRHQNGIWPRKMCFLDKKNRGNVTEMQGITLPDNSTTQKVNKEEAYKYLGILQAEVIKEIQVKRRQQLSIYNESGKY